MGETTVYTGVEESLLREGYLPAFNRVEGQAVTLPQEDRAALIGRLHRRGLTPNLTELLIDLEVDEVAREVVVAHLRAYDQHPSGRWR